MTASGGWGASLAKEVFARLGWDEGYGEAGTNWKCI